MTINNLQSSRAVFAKRSLFHFVILRTTKDLNRLSNWKTWWKTRFFTTFRMTICLLPSSRAAFAKRSRYTSQKQIATSLCSSQRRKITWTRRSPALLGACRKSRPRRGMWTKRRWGSLFVGNGHRPFWSFRRECGTALMRVSLSVSHPENGKTEFVAGVWWGFYSIYTFYTVFW